MDLKENAIFPGLGSDPARDALKFIKAVEGMQSAFTSMEKCNKPVIVGINGVCIGGGIDLITATDIRYCTKDAIFSIREVQVGIAADLGTLQRLPRIVKNESWVRELCFTGRDFGADEAMKYGLVSKVFNTNQELQHEVIKTAKLIAEKSPLATMGTKRLLNYSRDHSIDDGLEYSAVWNSVMLNSKDTMTAVKASLTGTRAIFPKL